MTEFTLDTSGRIAGHHGGLAVWYEFEDLSPFAQGYAEAAKRAFRSLKEIRPASGGDGVVYFDWGFSDLAPETLAAMLKDCAKFKADGYGSEDDDAVDGSMFWGTRQSLEWADVGFPPLTLYIGDDGRVYQKETN